MKRADRILISKFDKGVSLSKEEFERAKAIKKVIEEEKRQIQMSVKEYES